MHHKKHDSHGGIDLGLYETYVAIKQKEGNRYLIHLRISTRW